MFPTKESQGYWGVDHTRRVPYSIDWIDNRFGLYLDQVYGDRNKFLDEIARVVTISKTGELAYSHPSGGRVFVYDLAKPFPDHDFDLACPEIDVKGVLLTASGYNRNKNRLLGGNSRLEVAIHKERVDLFGPESLEESRADRDNTLSVRESGILTHIPGAILIPKMLSFEGRLVQARDIIDHFKLPADSVFALYVRIYPITSARSIDLVDWQYNICELPTIDDSPDQCFFPEGVIDIESAREALVKSRKAWVEIHRPRIMAALGIKKESGFDKRYFKIIYETMISQISRMILEGISPCSARESENQILNHTHLQNKTGYSAEVEWAPLTLINQLEQGRAQSHLDRLISSAHEHIINMGLLLLPDWTQIPNIIQFLTALVEETSDPRLVMMLKDIEGRPVDTIIRFLKLTSPSQEKLDTFVRLSSQLQPSR